MPGVHQARAQGQVVRKVVESPHGFRKQIESALAACIGPRRGALAAAQWVARRWPCLDSTHAEMINVE